MKIGIFTLADVLSLLGVLILLVRHRPTLGNCQLIFSIVVEFFTVLCPLLLDISRT